MANEIRFNYPSGRTLYAVVRRQSDGAVWYQAGAVFEAWGTGSRTADNYDIALTDMSGSFYMGDFPSGITTEAQYDVVVFERAGASPADTDYPVGNTVIRWNGSSAIDVWEAVIGPGELTVTVTIRTTDGTVIDGVGVMVSTTGSQSDAIPPYQTTNDLGQVTLYLDPDVTYYLHCTKSGYSFAAASFTPATGTTSFTKDIGTSLSTFGLTDNSLSVIRTRIEAHLPTGYFSDVLTTAKLTEVINKVLRRICRKHDFMGMSKLFSTETTDETRTISLPDGSTSYWRYKKDISVELVNADSRRIPLTCRDKESIENDLGHMDTTDAGIPSEYAIARQAIWLFPLPDHGQNSDSAWTVNINYYGYPPDLSNDSDTNFITDGCPEVLEYGALAECLELGKDFEEAAYWRAKYDSVLQELIEEDDAAQHGPLEQGFVPVFQNSVGFMPSGSRWTTTGGYVDE